MAPRDVIDSQEDEFNFPAPALVKLIDDVKASNGRAASISGSRPDWLIQYPLTLSDELLQGRWRCYIFTRVAAREGAAPGAALSAGLYDVKNKIETAAVPKTVAEMKNGEYHAVDLGVHKLHNGMYFWVAAPARADIESIKVDRVVLVRESESESFEIHTPTLLAPSAPLPEQARGAAPRDVIDSQEDKFNFPAPALVKLIDDAKASNGRAASMDGSRPDWLIQYPLTLSDELLQGSWRCYIFARVVAREGAAPGAALSAGLYDVKNKIETAAVPKTVAEMKDGEYHAVDLGVHKLHNGMYFWVAAPARADIESVNVDRVVLVRERD